MEIPELTLVRRILREFDLDPALALAGLLKALGDDHLAVLARIDRDPDDEEPVTTLETVVQIIRRKGDRNGKSFFKGMQPGMTEGQVSGYPKVAGGTEPAPGRGARAGGQVCRSSGSAGRSTDPERSGVGQRSEVRV